MQKSIALLGFGHTGQALAKRLSGFGMEILVYDKYIDQEIYQGFPYVKRSSIEEIQEKADILSLHLPLTRETKAWIDWEFLKKFKKPISLINTARGELLPISDLLKALDAGIVEAAGLDVFEKENPNTYSEKEAICYPELFQRENLLFSPHIAGWTQESKIRLSQILLEKILGQRASNVPNWVLAI